MTEKYTQIPSYGLTQTPPREAEYRELLGEEVKAQEDLAAEDYLARKVHSPYHRIRCDADSCNAGGGGGYDE